MGVGGAWIELRGAWSCYQPSRQPGRPHAPPSIFMRHEAWHKWRSVILARGPGCADFRTAETLPCRIAMLIIAPPATRSWPKHLVHWQHTTTLIVAIATPLLQPPRRTEQRQPMAAVPCQPQRAALAATLLQHQYRQHHPQQVISRHSLQLRPAAASCSFSRCLCSRASMAQALAFGQLPWRLLEAAWLPHTTACRARAPPALLQGVVCGVTWSMPSMAARCRAAAAQPQ